MAMGILPWHVRVCVHALTLPDKLSVMPRAV